MAKIITLTGASSSGKDAIFQRILNKTNIYPIISTTNRPIRQGEEQGVQYNFVNNNEIIYMLDNNEFIESREYKVANGEIWHYGITKNAIDLNSEHIYIVIVDLQGLKQLERYIEELGLEKDKIIFSIYIKTSAQERLKRSLNREGKMTDEQCNEVARRYLDDNINVLPAEQYCKETFENENMCDLESCEDWISVKINNWIKEMEKTN
jgi:guanylate kinase